MSINSLSICNVTRVEVEKVTGAKSGQDWTIIRLHTKNGDLMEISAWPVGAHSEPKPPAPLVSIQEPSAG